jgi:uncharacterized coiled-coil protein SlyX
MTLEPHPL